LLGTAFIPEMKEGSVVARHHRVPNISLDESVRMEHGGHEAGDAGAGREMAVSGVGRGESPADPAGPNESIRSSR
jgi:cobalt-zinc-cadmium resistance protein CzcA